MLASSPYAQLALIVAGLWLFVISFAIATVIAGAIGQWSARRRGWQCRRCDYRGNPAEVLAHVALEHDPPIGETRNDA